MCCRFIDCKQCEPAVPQKICMLNSIPASSSAGTQYVRAFGAETPPSLVMIIIKHGRHPCYLIDLRMVSSCTSARGSRRAVSGHTVVLLSWAYVTGLRARGANDKAAFRRWELHILSRITVVDTDTKSYQCVSPGRCCRKYVQKSHPPFRVYTVLLDP